MVHGLRFFAASVLNVDFRMLVASLGESQRVGLLAWPVLFEAGNWGDLGLGGDFGV